MVTCCLRGVAEAVTNEYQIDVGEGILVTQKVFKIVSSSS
jgi:hypothetical protein